MDIISTLKSGFCRGVKISIYQELQSFFKKKKDHIRDGVIGCGSNKKRRAVFFCGKRSATFEKQKSPVIANRALCFG